MKNNFRSNRILVNSLKCALGVLFLTSFAPNTTLAIPFGDRENKTFLAQTTAEGFYQVGNKHYDRQNWELAATYYSNALDLDPNHVLALMSRGICYRQLGELDKALADYTKVIEINPNYAAAYNNRGNIYNQQNKPDKALAEYERAIKANPNYFQAYFNRANIYEDRGTWSEALTNYNKVISLQPNYADAYLFLGNVYKNMNRLDLARNSLEKASQIYRQNGDNEYYQKAQQLLENLR